MPRVTGSFSAQGSGMSRERLIPREFRPSQFAVSVGHPDANRTDADGLARGASPAVGVPARGCGSLPRRSGPGAVLRDPRNALRANSGHRGELSLPGVGMNPHRSFCAVDRFDRAGIRQASANRSGCRPLYRQDATHSPGLRGHETRQQFSADAGPVLAGLHHLNLRGCSANRAATGVRLNRSVVLPWPPVQRGLAAVLPKGLSGQFPVQSLVTGCVPASYRRKWQFPLLPPDRFDRSGAHSSRVRSADRH
jgi:hypothetical protein